MPGLLTLVIETLGFRGVGIARHEGRVVFVPFTAPGDRIRARVVRARPDFWDAEIATLLEPGPDRRAPPCPHAEACGGCALMHLGDEAQRRAKAGSVAEALRRQARLTVDVPPAAAVSAPAGYRRRARMLGTWEAPRQPAARRAHGRPRGDDETAPAFRLGFQRRASHEVVDIPHCMVLEPALSAAFEKLRAVAERIGPRLGPLAAQGVVDARGQVAMLIRLGAGALAGAAEPGPEPGPDPAHGPSPGPDLRAAPGQPAKAGGAHDPGNAAPRPREAPVDPLRRGPKGQRAHTPAWPPGSDLDAAAVALPPVARLLAEQLEAAGIARVHIRGPEGLLWGGPPAPTAMIDRVAVGGHTLEYVFPPDGFVQASREGNQALVERVAALAAPVEGREVLDLYAGAGNIGLALAALGAHVTLVEQEEALAAAARETIRLAGLAGRARMMAMPVERALRELARSSPDCACAILDPPRTGARDILAGLTALRPRRILYVSCDPPTLARDVAILKSSGYELAGIEALDMFPQTFHVEAIALLTQAS